MDTINLPQKHPSKSDWQFLGALTFPVDGSTDSTVDSWLMELLRPINLPTDFLNRVLASAHKSVVRALHSTIAMELRHIHLSIFVPREHEIKGRTWGYFHIERIEDQADSRVSNDHAIDFYLYMEGE